MRYVHDRTVDRMNAGGDVWSAMREIRLPPELDVGEGYGKVAWDVRAIWETYLGWFHHQSTTELYGVPPGALHRDLVELAGGPEPLVGRAREKLASDAPVEAIHLAEIALAAEPAHRGALEVSLEAHRRLEAGTQNFWELSWLRSQSARLQQVLETA